MATGNKPLNAKILDGGASWKDRYLVNDNIVDFINAVATFSQQGVERCLLFVTGVNSSFTGGTNEKFPTGSVAIGTNNTGTPVVLVKKTDGTWGTA